MERLTGLDAAFLYLESPSFHMHVSMCAIVDPSTMPGGYSFAAFKNLVRARLPQLAPFRRRLVQVPFRLHHPVWVDCPDFDLDYHVRRVAVPSPGGEAELMELVSDITSRQLDRSRPLWEVWIIEGLEGGRVAVVAKVHHSAVDGVSGAEIMVHLFDLSPLALPNARSSSTALPPTAPANELVPSDAEMVALALRDRWKNPRRLADTARRTVRGALDVARRHQAPDAVGMPAPFTAPRVSFNASITPHRACRFATVQLEDVKTVKKRFGTTVNDVVLCLCAGALRRYLASRAELPEKPLVAAVPISVRGDASVPEGGANKVSAMFVQLATQLESPVDRLRAIAVGTRGAKEDHKAIGADKLQVWAEHAAPAIFALAARLYTGMKFADRHRPILNLVISNVPGPRFPLYFAGAELVGAYPLGPVMEGAGLNITAMSYRDEIQFGLHACRETVPDLARLPGWFDESMAELLEAANAPEVSTSVGA